ncbi:hypothetical protein [uncultured Friedmanniella sp.]|uniref:hypothetical protein n=1 Tax=uncultured Friedmanniella sp. TaxID=335381 RepID=UPI0035CAD055
MSEPGFTASSVPGLRVLATGASPRGDLLLRSRRTDAGEVTELIVNGVFAMDSVDTSSERALAARVPPAARRVLVGGLGLGYTTAALLGRDDLRLDRVDVIELEPLLVDWAYDGLTPVLATVAADPRVRLVVADVAVVLAGRAEPSASWDAILLDVDNGPDFLIHDANAALYGADLLQAAYGRLRPGGVLAIWCQGPARQLLATLDALGPAEEHRYRVTRGERSWEYAVYTVSRPHPGLGQNDGHG